MNNGHILFAHFCGCQIWFEQSALVVIRNCNFIRVRNWILFGLQLKSHLKTSDTLYQISVNFSQNSCVSTQSDTVTSSSIWIWDRLHVTSRSQHALLSQSNVIHSFVLRTIYPHQGRGRAGAYRSSFRSGCNLDWSPAIHRAQVDNQPFTLTITPKDNLVLIFNLSKIFFCLRVMRR